MEETERREVRSFMIRAGRLSPLQRRAIDEYHDTYCIDYTEGTFDLRGEFEDPDAPLILEIGFGMGVTTAAIAQKFPEKNFIGIEVHRPGIGKLLSEIVRLDLKNLKIIEYDAVKVLKHMIQPEGIDGVHIFFPDPWQKKKHHKRRLIQPGFVSLLCDRLSSDGYIYAVTDWEHYAWQMLEVLSGEKRLVNTSEKGFSEPLGWRPETKFEQKGLQKAHEIHELYFTKSS